MGEASIPRGRGTGLGLANVKKLLEEMGGTIEVETEIDAGTTFRFQLPVIQQQVIADTAESSMAPARSGTVLVVDDDVRVRAVVYATLERAGFHVLEAATPDSALEIARDGVNTVDLLVTDVVMPGRRWGGGDSAVNCRVSQCSGTGDVRIQRRRNPAAGNCPGRLALCHQTVYR